MKDKILIWKKSIKGTVLRNLKTLCILIVFSFGIYKIIDYIINTNKYEKKENHIVFENLNKDFIFSLIKLQIVYELPNSNFKHYIQFDFNVTKVGKKDFFTILTYKPLTKNEDSKSLNIKIKDIQLNNQYNKYLLTFDQNKTEAEVSLKFEGDIFGGNKYYREFLFYLEIDASKNIKNEIKIQPIFDAIGSVSLVEKSKLFIIKEDNPYYRLGEPISANNFHNLFLRFIDLEKKEIYQTNIVLLSILLGIFLSTIFNILSKLYKSYIENFKKNKFNKIE